MAGRAAWRRARPFLSPALGAITTLAALILLVQQLRGQDMASLIALIPVSIAFWALFAASLLVEPLTELCILHRLANVGREGALPLIRKQSYNALVFGYAGDTYILGWLQTRLGSARRAFALVCDLAIVSALVNNVATLVLLALVWKPLSLLAGARMSLWSVPVAAAVALVAVPFVLLAWQLCRRGSGMDFGTILGWQAGRTLAATILVALTWHFALPAVPMSSWLMLSAGRMVVSRLPIVPNKDLAFAGCVAIFVGGNAQIVPMIAGITMLTLLVHALILVALPIRGVARMPVQA